jgi:protein AroM
MARLGIATIGQAPRADLVALFLSAAPPGTTVVLRGCMDEFSRADIAARPPMSGADTLYSRLAGAIDVRLSKAHVIERAPIVLNRLREDGCDALVFACTGDFPPMEGDAGVIFPSRVLAGLAASLLPTGRLGLLVPLAEQRDKLAAKWARPGIDIVVEALAPSASPAEIEAAAMRLASARPDLVAMDCMSYTPDAKAAVRAATGVPTLLAITATGRVMAELMS